MPDAHDVPSDVARRSIWPWWATNQNWSDKLHKKAAHKALDIPEEEMIQANKIGLGGASVAAIAAGAGLLPIAGFLLASYLNKPTPATPTQPPAADSEYEVRFFDADGNPIKVPHISTRPTK